MKILAAHSLLEEQSSRINQILDEMLPKRCRVMDADYRSRRRQHDSQCLEDTRVELLKEIELWSESFDGPSIYWLNGMAGTGKSTVARTVAKYCQDLKRLGASFFFTRGQDGLSNAEKFMTTIAYQLARTVPSLATHMCEGLRRDPDILESNLGDQWKSLIFQPLQLMGEISQPMPLVIIVDALDECEGEKDIRLLIHLLSTIEELPRIRIRVLITSRPESTIRQAFKRLKPSTYHNVVLHELPKEIVERDIATYLKVQLELIRSDKGIDHAEWLDESEIQGLVQRANGLFIYASTVCLVLRDGKSGLRERLLMVLEKESMEDSWRKPLHTKYLDKIYTQALQQVLLGCDEFDLEYLPKIIRELVGTVCLLFTPLGAQSLRKLLHRSQGEIDMVLDNLRSVLTVPTGNDGGLIRLLHPSFRDFLVDSDRCNDSRFHVDAKQTHQSLFYSCLKVMEGSLKKDMCNLRNLGPMTATEKAQISSHLISAEFQYACRYWAHHLRRSKYLLCDGDIVHNFLQKHFLHWLEALSLVDITIEAVHTVIILEGELKVGTYRGIASEITNCEIEQPRR